MRLVFNAKCKSITQLDQNKTTDNPRYSSLIQFRTSDNKYDSDIHISIPVRLELGQTIQIIVTDEQESQLAESIPEQEYKQKYFNNPPPEILSPQPIDYPIVGAAASRTIAECYPNKLDRFPSKV